MLAMVGWLVGCATDTKQRWLTFFFDGVPQPGAETNHAPAQVSGAVQPTNAVAAAPTITRVKMINHPPYEKEECTKCHESAFSQKMRGKPGEACFACHKNLPASAKEKHAPFENGECASCHEPHQGTIPKLLKKKPDVLCADCHDIPDKKSKAVHQPVANGECLSCHNPHGTRHQEVAFKARRQALFRVP